jgi:hypothetical protein
MTNTNNNYPREIKLSNEELKELIIAKGKLVDEGREKSREIEKVEEEMDATEKLLMEEEKKVNLDEFSKKEAFITKRMEKCIADMDKLKVEIYEKIKSETPQEIRDKYDELKKQKDELETERNKIALSAQKYNDKIIPLSRELIKPHLQDDYEDNETIRVENDELKATIFSHLNDFKIRFNTTKKN